MFRIDSDAVIDATMAGGPARYINHSCMVSFPRRKFATFVSPVVDLDLYSNSDDRLHPVCVVGELLDVFFLRRSQIQAIIFFFSNNETFLVTVSSLPHSIFLKVLSKFCLCSFDACHVRLGKCQIERYLDPKLRSF